MKRQYMILVCTCIAILMFLAIVPFSTSLMYTASHIPDYIKRNIPLDFTGQILDQNNKPIEGVDVLFDYEATSWTGNVRRYPIQSRSDKDGLFKIRGYRGIQIGYRKMEKDGYYFRKWQDDGHVYVYSPSNGPKYVPDPVKPEMFYGWKFSGKQEQLGAIRGHGPKLPLNGDIISVYLDKFTVRTVPGAKPDATWWFSATGKYDNYYKVLKCTYTIKCLKGSIQRCEDGFGFYAPENGYTDKITTNVVMTANGIQQRDSFYWQNENGKIIGSMSLLISNWRKEISILMSGAISSSGSRNLEPGKDILNP